MADEQAGASGNRPDSGREIGECDAAVYIEKLKSLKELRYVICVDWGAF